MVQNFDDDVTNYDADIVTVTPGKSMKNFKYWAISLNMLHTGGLFGELKFTASLSFCMINLSKFLK